MPVYSAPIDVFRKAMVLVGAAPASSIDDQTAEAIAANAVYEGMVEELLTRHAWSWAQKVVAVTYQGETDNTPQYAYSLPSDVLTIRYVLLDKVQFTDYALRGGKLLCNVSSTTDLDIVYNYRALESDWPSDFAWGVVQKLAASLLRGLLDRQAEADRFDAEGEKMIRRASVRDRRSYRSPVDELDPPLIRARRGTSLGRVNTYVTSS